jgi:bidirectional [NiFe] hydrogenase diaphorase subunit
MSEPVKFSVNGREIEAEKDSSLLKALLKAGFDVPHLCYLETVTPYASCRLCLVEIDRGRERRIATSCNYPVMPGMKVLLDTAEVLEQRRSVFEVLLAQAPGSARLWEYAARYGVFGTTLKVQEGECILCGLCEQVCSEVIGACAVAFSGRGANKEITTPYQAENQACIGCGSCARSCPTGCIKIVDSGLVREMPFIRAKHELVPCRVCGEATLTRPHARWLSERTKIPEADFYICDRCKARQTAQGYALLPR